MTALSSHQQLALTALLGHCEATLKVGVVENEAAFGFLLDQVHAAFGLPARHKPSDVTVSFASAGFHAHDDKVGQTKEQALTAYHREKVIQVGDHDPEPLDSADYDAGMRAVAAIFGGR